MTGGRNSRPPIGAAQPMLKRLVASGYSRPEARHFAYTYHADEWKCRPRVQAWKNFCQTVNVVRYGRNAFRQAEGLSAKALRAWQAESS